MKLCGGRSGYAREGIRKVNTASGKRLYTAATGVNRRADVARNPQQDCTISSISSERTYY